MEILNPKEEQKLESIDDDSGETQYQRRYAPRDQQTVTEKEFNHHYWAIANNLLSSEEIGVLNSAVGNINVGQYYERNADGFYMIPVGENGVFNKIVFTDGKHNTYSIDTVIEIDLSNETELSIVRESIYESESKGISTKNSYLFKVHYGKNYGYNEFKRKGNADISDSNGEQDGTGSIGETQEQRRDTALTDREILELAANKLVIDDLDGLSNKIETW